MTNYVQFALPGLMPPVPTNELCEIIAKADGSLKLCIWCGQEEDVVTYAAVHGLIRYWPHCKACSTVTDEDEYLSVVDEVSADTIVPFVKWHGRAHKIDERCDLDKAGITKKYWVLTLPPKTLRPGDTELEVNVNGHIINFVVQVPVAFTRHHKED